MTARLDLSGQRFGKLVAKEHMPGSRREIARWRCLCDCGTFVAVHQYNLRKGRTRSCGCLIGETPAGNRANIAGQVFGRLTAVAFAGRNSRQGLWRCRCECGGQATTTVTKLRSGHTTSCGCFKNEGIASRARKDGLFVGGRHRLFDTYHKMVARCTNPNDAAYEDYGGRGISVCDRWLKGEGQKTGFSLFLKDMGPRPSSRYSLDRRENNGNYEPANCRWATAKQQARNRRSNRLVDCDGRKLALSEFCDRKGLRFNLVNGRIGRGWSFERAISQPVRGGGSLTC